MVDILVHPVELRQISEQLRSSARKIGTALQAIDQEILSLKGDNFLGNRANTMQAYYAPKREVLLKARGIVAHFAEDLQSAASRFEAADTNQSGAYTLERRDLLRREMQRRYDQLKNDGHIPALRDKFDSEIAIGTVLLNPENRKTIEEMAKKYGIDPVLLAGAVAAEMDLDYDNLDYYQDGLGRNGTLDILKNLGVVDGIKFLTGKDITEGPGVANVHTPSLIYAVKYLGTNDLPGKDFAQNYDWSSVNRTSFNGSVEAAAIVLAMYTHAHGGASTSDDMAVIWGAYKSGIAGFVPNDQGEGYASVEDFSNNIANGGTGEFTMGVNAYYAQPYFEFFREAFSQSAPDVIHRDLPVPQIVPPPTPPVTHYPSN